MHRYLRALALAAVLLFPASLTAAQDVDEERPPGSEGEGGGYAWQPEETAGPSQPSRFVFTLGGGSGLRIIKNIDFDQQQFAPAYLDFAGVFVLPGSGTWRHGLGLTLSTNLTGDGSDAVGVDGFSQFTFAPTYLAYFRLSETFLVTAHAAVPIGIGTQPSGGSDNLIGLDVGAGAALYLLAGAGIYGEISFATWMGSETTFHPIADFEAGFIIDYEVLP